LTGPYIAKCFTTTHDASKRSRDEIFFDPIR